MSYPTYMLTHFLPRLRREIRLTVEGTREALIAVSERVNRRVHGLKLQWQTAYLSEQIDQTYRVLGERLAARRQSPTGPATEDLTFAFARTSGELAALRRQLAQIEGRIRELETEALREALLKLQQDLGLRALTLDRLVVPARSPVVGRTLAELGLSEAVRPLLIFRGPAVLDAGEQVPLRPGDILIVLGPPGQLPRTRALIDPPLV